MSFYNIGRYILKIYIRGILLSALSWGGVSYIENLKQQNTNTHKNLNTNSNTESKQYQINIKEYLAFSGIILAWPMTIPLISILGGSGNYCFAIF